MDGNERKLYNWLAKSIKSKWGGHHSKVQLCFAIFAQSQEQCRGSCEL